MGNWSIHVQGIGCHHNNNAPKDADVMAADFVKLLREAGHTIEVASFTSGSKIDLNVSATPKQTYVGPAAGLESRGLLK